MNKNSKNILVQFIAVAFLYALVLFVSIRLMQVWGESFWRFLAAILPIIPIGLGIRVYIRYFERVDELEKRIHLYALAFSFGTTGILTATFGLLQNAGLPQVSFITVFPSMLALWGIGYMIASVKYQ
jgi:magnesium-transporting ATPase (P-type)